MNNVRGDFIMNCYLEVDLGSHSYSYHIDLTDKEEYCLYKLMSDIYKHKNLRFKEGCKKLKFIFGGKREGIHYGKYWRKIRIVGKSKYYIYKYFIGKHKNVYHDGIKEYDNIIGRNLKFLENLKIVYRWYHTKIDTFTICYDNNDLQIFTGGKLVLNISCGHHKYKNDILNLLLLARESPTSPFYKDYFHLDVFKLIYFLI